MAARPSNERGLQAAPNEARARCSGTPITPAGGGPAVNSPLKGAHQSDAELMTYLDSARL